MSLIQHVSSDVFASHGSWEMEPPLPEAVYLKTTGSGALCVCVFKNGRGLLALCPACVAS